MKLSKWSVICLVNIVLMCTVAAAAWQSQPDQLLTADVCTAPSAVNTQANDMNDSELCTKQDDVPHHVTWGSWLAGKSRSAQFHFLDLFELLFGSTNKKQHDYKPF